jgi:hypothetical protein
MAPTKHKVKLSESMVKTPEASLDEHDEAEEAMEQVMEQENNKVEEYKNDKAKRSTGDFIKVEELQVGLLWQIILRGVRDSAISSFRSVV